MLDSREIQTTPQGNEDRQEDVLDGVRYLSSVYKLVIGRSNLISFLKTHTYIGYIRGI